MGTQGLRMDEAWNASESLLRAENEAGHYRGMQINERVLALGLSVFLYFHHC